MDCFLGTRASILRYAFVREIPPIQKVRYLQNLDRPASDGRITNDKAKWRTCRRHT